MVRWSWCCRPDLGGDSGVSPDLRARRHAVLRRPLPAPACHRSGKAPYLMRGVATAPPVREGDDDFFAVYNEVQRLEAFHTLAHDDSLMRIMRRVLGDSAFPHPLKIARLGFPEHYEVSTPPHQDYP